MAGKYSTALIFLMIFVCGMRLVGQATPNTALLNGKWFDGTTFKSQSVYSVNGMFTLRKPSRIDKTLDLSGTWIIPPLADAHNHSIGTGVQAWDRAAIERFLTAGVFYVKIMGNLPISDEAKRSLSLNNPEGLDVVFGQGTITASGGQPIGLIENMLLPQGYYPGFTKEMLRDYRYFTIDSEEELEEKWSLVLRNRPDHIKTFLWSSDEYETRKNDPSFFGQRALNPKLLPRIIAKARAAALRVSAHVTTAEDFRVAVEAGVDEIAHLPYLGSQPIAAADAELAARKGIVVVTTAKLITWIPKNALPDADRPGVEKAQTANLKLLFETKVPLAIGSDNTKDTSFEEVMFLRKQKVFSDSDLLRIWTDTTARAIFPGRKIGRLDEGYEASFLALEADPLVDLANVRSIKYRFKQGVLLDPAKFFKR